MTVLPVLATNVDQVEPPLVNLSISYPVIGEPPLFVGADQFRLIWEDEAVTAVNPTGDNGGIIGVVVDAVLDGELIPTELIADT